MRLIFTKEDQKSGDIIRIYRIEEGFLIEMVCADEGHELQTEITYGDVEPKLINGNPILRSMVKAMMTREP